MSSENGGGGTQITRSVSFSDSVFEFEAYSAEEYRRMGYKNGEVKKVFKCHAYMHDKNPAHFYCELDDSEDEGEGQETEPSLSSFSG